MRSAFIASILLSCLVQQPYFAAEGHPHHLALASGYARQSHKDAGFVGLEYEYRVSSKFGIGGYAETTWGDFDLEAGGLIFTYRPSGGWKIFGGPGVERKLGTKKDKGLVRLGVGYDFHFRNVSIGPMVAVDLIEDLTHVTYVGVAFGIGF